MNTSLQILCTYKDYSERRKAQANDRAWANDNGVTNYKFKDGDRVVLLVSTIADYAMLGAGTVGTLVRARTPRVMQPCVRKPGTYIYFANVDFEIGGVIYRGRVPHNALRRAK